MDSNTGFVRYDKPHKNAVPIPERFSAAAKWCADNGVALHSDANPHAESRAWALRNLHRGDPRDDLATTPASAQDFSLRGWSWPTNNEARHARTQQRKAETKRRRKLQKQRGLR